MNVNSGLFLFFWRWFCYFYWFAILQFKIVLIGSIGVYLWINFTWIGAHIFELQWIIGKKTCRHSNGILRWIKWIFLCPHWGRSNVGLLNFGGNHVELVSVFFKVFWFFECTTWRYLFALYRWTWHYYDN